jgi:alpha-glucoside transport system substrate-binding protein
MHLKRLTAATAAGVLLVTTAVACSSSGKKDSGAGGTTNPSGSAAPSGVPDPGAQPKSKIKAATLSGDCAPFGIYGSYPGKTVTVYSSITDPEGASLQKSWKQFEKCTGITVQYTADKEFEAGLKTKVQGGNAPDLAIFPQPGLVQTFATSGKLKPATDVLTKEAEANWTKTYIPFSTVDGEYFGAPMGSSVKSLIWYSPKSFAKNGYTVPTTWDEMIKLSDKMAADGNKPWCVGIESGAATGWPLTDWMEEVMLRLHGADVYDKWVNHEIPFNDPQVADVLKMVGDIVKNPKYTNAGIGGVKSIATTSFQKGGLPIEKGKCQLHAQASFYGSNWDKGYTIGADPTNDLFAFYEPTISDKFGKTVEGGAEFVGAFSDKPEAEAFQVYLASGEWATSRAKVAPGWTSANLKMDKTAYTSPVDKLAAEILADPKVTFRFDGSDAMPSSVGSGTFWTQMTQWILGQDDKTTLDKIEASWPK